MSLLNHITIQRAASTDAAGWLSVFLGGVHSAQSTLHLFQFSRNAPADFICSKLKTKAKMAAVFVIIIYFLFILRICRSQLSVEHCFRCVIYQTNSNVGYRHGERCRLRAFSIWWTFVPIYSQEELICYVVSRALNTVSHAETSVTGREVDY